MYGGKSTFMKGMSSLIFISDMSGIYNSQMIRLPNTVHNYTDIILHFVKIKKEY